MNIENMAEIMGKLDATNCSSEEAYAGYVMYRPANSYCNDDFVIWIIPGTYFLDWDN